MKTLIQKYIPYILAILAIIFAIFFYKNTPSDKNREIFAQEKILLETQIAKERKIRAEKKEIQEKLYAEWQKADKELEASINEKKERLEAVKTLLGEKSGGIIPTANAETTQELNGNGEPTIAEPQRKTEIQCAIGTGYHDVRHLAKNYPWVAGWKNNNPSGITLGSKALEKAFDDAGIKWFVGTARPKNEGSHYYGFPDLENWMRAKLLIIKRSYKNHTIASYLRIWWTDEIPIEIPKSRTIGSLSDSELISLIKPQIRKESGKDFTDFIFKNVLICN